MKTGLVTSWMLSLVSVSLVFAEVATVEIEPDVTTVEEMPEATSAEEVVSGDVTVEVEEAVEVTPEPAPTGEALESPSLEDLNKFPEVYLKQRLELDSVKISGDIKTDFGFYCMEVIINDKEKIEACLKRPGVTFVVSGGFLKKLLKIVRPKEDYTVRMRCEVEGVKILGNHYWIARVSEMDILGPEGETIETVK